MNKVILLGNLTRDPELTELQSGSKVAKFGVAHNRKYNDSEGNKKEETTFVDINVWGAQAENCAKYLSKGRQALIEGYLKLESWETDNGEKRSKLSVTALNVQFIGGQGEGGESTEGSASKSKAKGKKKAATQDDFPTGEIDDDVPF